MRVLFVSPNSWMYGAERSLLLAVKGLAAQGVEPVVLSRGPGLLVDTLIRENIPTYAESYFCRSFRRPFSYLAWLRRFAKIVHQVRPDVIHCNDRDPSQFVVPVAWWSGVPFVCHVRNMTTASSWQLHTGLSYWADRYVANSEAMQDDLVRHGYDGTRIVRIYNPVDTSLFDLTRDRETTPTIGIVGQIEPRKGHDSLFSALVSLSDLDWRCAVFGDLTESQDYTEKLHDQLRAGGLSDRVDWAGYISDLDRIYVMIDVLAVPSVREPFGRVAAEAMASGIPVVAFAVDGLKEIVVHGETGFLVPSGDVDALAEALRRLIEDPVLRREMGSRGRERARNLFGIDAHVGGLMDVYTQAIGGRRWK